MEKLKGLFSQDWWSEHLSKMQEAQKDLVTFEPVNGLKIQTTKKKVKEFKKWEKKHTLPL